MPKDYSICEFCGGDDAAKEYLGRCPVGWCGCVEGRREFQAYDEEVRAEAERDNYDRYRF